MVSSDDRAFIEEFLDRYAEHLRSEDMMVLPARLPSDDPEDGGVPPEMMEGEIDSEGWVRWKMLPSRVSEEQIRNLEERLPGPLPPLFRAYLTTRFTMDVEWGEVRLPGVPSDNPLQEIERAIDDHDFLLGDGYVAFGDSSNDIGPLCFDMHDRLPDGDCAVVLFDHEYLGPFIDSTGSREDLELIADYVADSFRSLLQEVMSEDPLDDEDEDEDDDME